MNLDNDLSRVIDRTSLIENILDQIISNYILPSEKTKDFFWDVVLDSSIISLGSKLKLVKVIAFKLHIKLKQNDLHTVISYRNAFAHHDIQSHPRGIVNRGAEDCETTFNLHIIRNSGKTELINRKDAIIEFDTCFFKAKESLLELNDAIKN